MDSDAAVLAIIDALNSNNIPYILSGSFATNYYGVPRSTQDADFVVELGETTLSALKNSLGPEFIIDPQISFESITATQRYVIGISGSKFKIELFLLSDDAHDQERFRRRQKVLMDGNEVFLPTVEDVVVMKLLWTQRSHRHKDMDDLINVLTVQRASMDMQYVRRWAQEHGTEKLLDQMLDEVSDI